MPFDSGYRLGRQGKGPVVEHRAFLGTAGGGLVCDHEWTKRPFEAPVKSVSGPFGPKDPFSTVRTTRRVTPAMAAVIKLARRLGYKYEVIASYYVLNQGRVADVMMGRKFPDVAPASELPQGFPALI